jgi:hypothetical protein
LISKLSNTCVAPLIGAEEQRKHGHGFVLFGESYGPKGQDNLAQGLPWELRFVTSYPVRAPESRSIMSRSEVDRRPFRAQRDKTPKPRVNPGLRYLDPSGRMIGTTLTDPWAVFPLVFGLGPRAKHTCGAKHVRFLKAYDRGS